MTEVLFQKYLQCLDLSINHSILLIIYNAPIHITNELKIHNIKIFAPHLFEYYRANSPIFIVPKGLNENSPFGGVLNFADGSAVERQSSALAGCKMLKLSQSSPGGRCNGLRAAQNVKLGENAMQMSLDSKFADKELGGDFLVALAAGE